MKCQFFADERNLYTMTITKKVGQLKEEMGPKIEEYYNRARSEQQGQEPSAKR